LNVISFVVFGFIVAVLVFIGSPFLYSTILFCVDELPVFSNVPVIFVGFCSVIVVLIGWMFGCVIFWRSLRAVSWYSCRFSVDDVVVVFITVSSSFWFLM
jgi:hypothetical protein